jgi:hypothetical protein
MSEWRNRIVGNDLADPRTLSTNPYNWRAHPKKQQEALRAAIRDLGYLRSVTVNKRTGNIIDGHLRVELAIFAGQDTIPVEYVDLDEAEEAEAIATFDPITAMAGAEPEALDRLLREIASDEPQIQQLLSDLAQDAGLNREEYGFMEPGEGAANARPASDDAAMFTQFPLAIVLTREEFNRWREIKLSLGAMSDKEALLMLWPAAAEDGNG